MFRPCEDCVYPSHCCDIGQCEHVKSLSRAFEKAHEASPSQHLPEDSEARKHVPLATGCLDYFPEALAAIAELSFLGNEKHNPGEPLHWSRGKSNDHPDCMMRHFLDRGKVDHAWDGLAAKHGLNAVRHSVEMAWRALAIAQLEIEAARINATDRDPYSRIAKELASRKRDEQSSEPSPSPKP